MQGGCYAFVFNKKCHEKLKNKWEYTNRTLLIKVTSVAFFIT